MPGDGRRQRHRPGGRPGSSSTKGRRWPSPAATRPSCAGPPSARTAGDRLIAPRRRRRRRRPGRTPWSTTSPRSFGRIDILVNNAGLNIKERTFRELTPETWQLLLAGNLDGRLLLHAGRAAADARRAGRPDRQRQLDLRQAGQPAGRRRPTSPPSSACAAWRWAWPPRRRTAASASAASTPARWTRRSWRHRPEPVSDEQRQRHAPAGRRGRRRAVRRHAAAARVASRSWSSRRRRRRTSK